MNLRVFNRLCTNKYLHHYSNIHYWVLLFVFLMWLSSLINEDVFLNWVDFKLVFSIYVNHPRSADRRGRNNPSGFLLQLRQSDRWRWRWVCRKQKPAMVAGMQKLGRHAKSKLRPISHSYDLLITLVELVISISFFLCIWANKIWGKSLCRFSFIQKEGKEPHKYLW